MEPEVLALGIGVVGTALLFDFLNGFHDSSNIVATMISTQAIAPGKALFIAAFFECAGALFLGTAVARTIASGIVNTSLLSGPADVWVIIAALAAAISWNLATWFYGMPSSSSHALIGGLVGAFFCRFGTGVFLWKSLLMLIAVLVCAPLIVLCITYGVTAALYYVARRYSPSINRVFKHLQVLSSIGVALASGTNDAQKTMGVIAFALVLLGVSPRNGTEIAIPVWVILACSVTIGLGIAFGGWRISRTLGNRFYTLRPIHGFAAQSASCALISAASLFGFPVSATQVVTSSIMGAGACQGFRRVRWQVFSQVAFTWLITLPVACALGWLYCSGTRIFQ